MFVIPWTRPPIVDEATIDDIHTLADIHNEGFARGWSADEFATLIAQDGVLALAARRSGPGSSSRPIGFVLVRRAGEEAEILTIAVTRRRRQRGVARLLMQAALRRLYEDRVVEVFLEVNPDNVAAISLYRRLDFRPVGERRGYYHQAGDAAAALVMRLDLR
ncbi:MAG: GNAT family N-acetyltransferase [Hyphomicrobiales bacterium]|nr:GNAT family N-acetyltransferase [Hyphomicrobiales bacterium]